MDITIETLRDLDENTFRYRFGSPSERRRPPTFKQLVAFIRARFADRFEAHVENWSETPCRIVGNRRHDTGKRRDGYRLEVWPRGEWLKTRNPVFSHVTCETYRTNWDIVAFIAKAHRREV